MVLLYMVDVVECNLYVKVGSLFDFSTTILISLNNISFTNHALRGQFAISLIPGLRSTVTRDIYM